jgi:hypothetical protein
VAQSVDFTKLVPGFDFLQGLMKNAGAALPSMGQWIAPTLNPEDLNKRIEELRTVQFWLEQNARMLGATIQALEVQRMTLSTLETMNLPVGDMVEAFKIRTPPAPAPAPARKSAVAEPAAPPAPAPKPPKPARKPAATPKQAESAPAGVVDPMQWWGALTQQFTELAAKTLRDVKIDGAAPTPAAKAGTPADAGKPAKARPARKAAPKPAA